MGESRDPFDPVGPGPVLGDPWWSRAWAVWVPACVVVGLCPLLVVRLRSAHLYRQRTGEGLGFFGAAVLLGILLAMVGLCVVAAQQRRRRPDVDQVEGRVLVIVAVLAVLVAVMAVVASIWVESHGRRCILGCPEEVASRGHQRGSPSAHEPRGLRVDTLMAPTVVGVAGQAARRRPGPAR